MTGVKQMRLVKKSCRFSMPVLTRGAWQWTEVALGYGDNSHSLNQSLLSPRTRETFADVCAACATHPRVTRDVASSYCLTVIK